MTEKTDDTLPRLNCDERAILKGRILTAIQMGILLDREAVVQADRDMFELAVDAIAEGCAWEVGRVFGKMPPLQEPTDYGRRRPGFRLMPRKSSRIPGATQDEEPK